MKKIKHLSKAETLEYLDKYKKILNVEIPKLIYFNKISYIKNPKKYLLKIKKIFKKTEIIIRSSSKNEDGLKFSNAGKYQSFSKIKPSDEKKINYSIQKIISDFQNNNDQILVQKFISNPKCSGVIFTRTLEGNAPYYVINYDLSGKTNLITSGKQVSTMRTLTIFKKKILNYKFFQINLKNIALIEKKLNNDRLDIEFCIKNRKIFILQSRPLKKIPKTKDQLIEDSLVNITKKIKKLSDFKHDLSGKKTIFSNMSDWNPAEMIGEKPNSLAISLYKNLITNYIWSKQRYNYGYKNCKSSVLMFDFLGAPYIDLRTDLNSFLPKKLSKKIGAKTINHCIQKLRTNKHLHDKIEFDIIETCYTPETKINLKKFLSKKDANTYTKLLLELTNKIICNDYLKNEIGNINSFEKNLKIIKNENYHSIEKIYRYINLIKEQCVLPFAGIARSAFISKKIIDFFYKKKMINKENFDRIFSTLNTITTQINKDLYKLKTKRISKITFKEKYGHIRPSMYNIDSKNYNQAFNQYFDLNTIVKKKYSIKKKINFKFTDHNLKKYGYKFSKKQFLDFCQKSIHYREFTKNLLSKGIDLIFIEIKKISKELQLSEKNLKFMNIETLYNAQSSLKSTKLKKEIMKEIFENKKNFKILKHLNLPDLITNSNDLYFYESFSHKEKYITEKIVKGDLIFLDLNKSSELKNKIVLIKNADPGYDFIFSRDIAGFVTAYGGENSHMSIRALELNIPAAIGIGLDKFNMIKKSKKVLLDCLNKKLIY